MTTLTLYDYFRSTASYRVRVALLYKGLAFERQEIHLLEEGGQQFSDDYKQLNPQSLVPTLSVDEDPISQSMAILEYLEETHPEPALLPSDPLARAKVRSLAQSIVCDIHPLNNLRVLKYLTGPMGVDEEKKMQWYRHWIAEGFTALEQRLANDHDSGKFCYGDSVTIADLCLVPQLYNARRFDCAMDAYPKLLAIDEACMGLECFKGAAP